MSFFQQLQHKSKNEEKILSCRNTLFELLFAHFKKDILISILLGSFTAIFTLSTSMISGFVFDHIHESSPYLYFVIFLCFIISASIFSYINELLIKCLNVKMTSQILPDICKHLFNLPITFIKTMESGDVIERISQYESCLSMIVKLYF